MGSPQMTVETGIEVLDQQADAEYRQQLRLNPQAIADTEHQWKNTRPLLLSPIFPERGPALEFGCAFGATAVMLARLGWDVTGIDIDERRVMLSQLNAVRYGVHANFQHVLDTEHLPFPSAAFSLISANSVLEYVAAEKLRGVCAEIDRVLKPGGILFIGGTSNRLMPRETHSKRWFVNYLPTDRWQQGLWPWELKRLFRGYSDKLQGNDWLLKVKSGTGMRAAGLAALKCLDTVARVSGTSLGTMLPSICLVLQKPKN
jgi:SAM-dependent methyltransferase